MTPLPWLATEADCIAERVKDGAFCFPGVVTVWGGLLGSGGFALAVAYSCEVVLPPELDADGAISRAVMSSYSGQGTLPWPRLLQ